VRRSIARCLPPLTALARCASMFAAGVGLLVLVGWASGLDVLTRVLPGLVAMNPATALSFVAAGLSLWLVGAGPAVRRARHVGLALGLLVALVGLAKLVGVLTGWDPGLDQVLFPDQLVARGMGLPNRMAPNTALAFLLIGLALAGLHLEPVVDQRLAQLCALVATVIASLAAIGYVYGVPALSGVSSYIHMALNTALTFVVLSVGVLFARTDRGLVAVITSAGPGGTLARAQLPIAILLPVILGWLRLKGQQLGLYTTTTGLTIAVVYSIYLSVVLIWLGARALERLEGARKRAEDERIRLRAAELATRRGRADPAARRRVSRAPGARSRTAHESTGASDAGLRPTKGSTGAGR